jgi:anti-anti-sigma factor
MDVLPSGAEFRVESRRVGSYHELELIGELDISTAPILEEAIDKMSPIPDHIKVDMSQLDFIDSVGLRLLLRSSELVAGRIWLKGPTPFVAKVFKIAGVSDLFNFAEDREATNTSVTGDTG